MILQSKCYHIWISHLLLRFQDTSKLASAFLNLLSSILFSEAWHKDSCKGNYGSENLQKSVVGSNIKSDQVELREKVYHKLVIGSWYTNSFSNKVEHLKKNLKSKVNILDLRESKLDSSFSNN